MTTITPFMEHVRKEIKRIKSIGDFNRIAAAHVAESTVRAWNAYCDEMQVSQELRQSITADIIWAIPEGVM